MAELKRDTPTHKDEEDNPKPTQKAQAQQSSYPAGDNHIKAFEAMHIQYEDNPIGRAWCRLFDQGQHLGPAMTKVYQIDDGYEHQVFSNGYASRSLDEANVNQTVEFFDARGFVGSESGI